MNIDQDRIPSTLTAAAEAVANGLDEAEMSWLRSRCVSRSSPGRRLSAQARQAVTECHNGLGRHLRNLWSLNDEPPTPLREDVRRLRGVVHPDDVSSLILLAGFMLALGATPRAVALATSAEAAWLLDHWRKMGCAPNGQPLPSE